MYTCNLHVNSVSSELFLTNKFLFCFCLEWNSIAWNFILLKLMVMRTTGMTFHYFMQIVDVCRKRACTWTLKIDFIYLQAHTDTRSFHILSVKLFRWLDTVQVAVIVLVGYCCSMLLLCLKMVTFSYGR